MKNLKALRILAASALAAALAAPVVSAQPASALNYATKPQIGVGVSYSSSKGIQAKIGFGKRIGHGVKSHIGVGYPKPGYGHKPNCGPQWIPGRWVTESQRVWVPAREVQVWVEPVYATKCDYFGHTHKVLVTPGHFKTVCEPGYWSTERVRVWKQGYWA